MVLTDQMSNGPYGISAELHEARYSFLVRLQVESSYYRYQTCHNRVQLLKATCIYAAVINILPYLLKFSEEISRARKASIQKVK